MNGWVSIVLIFRPSIRSHQKKTMPTNEKWPVVEKRILKKLLPTKRNLKSSLLLKRNTKKLQRSVFFSFLIFFVNFPFLFLLCCFFKKKLNNWAQVKNINLIELGRFEIDTWYFSPYPEELCKMWKAVFVWVLSEIYEEREDLRTS